MDDVIEQEVRIEVPIERENTEGSAAELVAFASPR